MARVKVYRWLRQEGMVKRRSVTLMVNGVTIPGISSYSITEAADGISMLMVQIPITGLAFHDDKPPLDPLSEPYDWGPDGMPEGKPFTYSPEKGYDFGEGTASDFAAGVARFKEGANKMHDAAEALKAAHVDSQAPES